MGCQLCDGPKSLSFYDKGVKWAVIRVFAVQSSVALDATFNYV